jgi:hypothetical protein
MPESDHPALGVMRGPGVYGDDRMAYWLNEGSWLERENEWAKRRPEWCDEDVWREMFAGLLRALHGLALVVRTGNRIEEVLNAVQAANEATRAASAILSQIYGWKPTVGSALAGPQAAQLLKELLDRPRESRTAP